MTRMRSLAALCTGEEELMRQQMAGLVVKTATVACLALSAVACSDGFMGLGGDSGVEGYRVFDEFVALTPVANRFIVEFDADISVQEATERLGARGLVAAETVALEGQAGHFEVLLDHSGLGSSIRQRAALLRLARQVSGLRFLAPVYQVSDGSEVRPLNLVMIQARPGLSTRQVGELFARHGLEQVVRPIWSQGMWHARFRSVVDAYGATNVLYADPSVEWAALDAISGRFQHF